MKKILSYIIAGCLSLSFSGCLDMEPVSNITDTNYWKDPAQFSAFNIGLHGLLRERSFNIFLFGESRADIYGGVPFTGEATRGYERLWQNNLSQISPVISNFGDFYTIINQLNLMINRTEGTDVLDKTTRDYYLAEAYGMRAYVYFHLLRTYGKCVLRLDPTEGSNIDLGNVSMKESSEDVVMEQIKKDIKSSEDYFGEDYSFKFGKSFWSKAATLMLKGEVYLWSGRHMNGGESDFKVAKTALENVSKSGVKLIDDFKKVFAYDNKENDEIIFAIHNGRDEYSMWNDQYRMTMVLNNQNFKILCDENGTLLESTELKDMNGLIIFPLNLDLNKKLFRDGDKRKESTLKEIYKKNTETGSLEYQAPVAYKFQGVLLEGSSQRSWLDDYPIYRYADCLLLLATAKAFLNEDITAEINAVRERAYGKEYFQNNISSLGYPNDNDANFYSGNSYMSSDSEPIEAILKERMREFVYEGKRWYDIRLMGDEYATKYSSATSDKLLWPIDENSLGENSALEQTPGYEMTSNN